LSQITRLRSHGTYDVIRSDAQRCRPPSFMLVSSSYLVGACTGGI
jgi:hypothetical protein